MASVEELFHQRNKVLRLINIWASSFYSRVDGVAVTVVRCSNCALLFQELLTEAEAKIISGVDFECINCDRMAESISESYRNLRQAIIQQM